MSIRFTGNKTALRRNSNLPSAHNAFTICGFAKLLVAEPARQATIAYTQTSDDQSAESVHLVGASGVSLQAADDYTTTFSSTVATVTAGGASGANWFFFALVGVGSGANGLRLYHSSVGGTPSFQSVNNKGGSTGFSAIQFGDIPWGSTYWFDGLLAHLKIYDRILSDVELAAEAARGSPASTSSLISYHSFSSGTLSTALVPDQGTGTFGVFTADPSTSTDMPVFTSGATLSGSDTLPERTATAPLVITNALVGGTVGVAYSQTLQATGDTPITWSITSGSLPSGVTLNASTGVLSGTPASATTASFTVTATNAVGSNARALSITIGAAPGAAPVVTTTTLIGGVVGSAYTQTLVATGTTPITWTVTAGALPFGMSLAALTGVISGTPTVSGSYTFTVTATNGSGSNARALSVVIAAAPSQPSENDGWTRLPRDVEVWVRIPRATP